MIDMHCHILFGIDDGCKTADESLETIKNMKSLGFNSLVLTPHYIKGANYNCNNKMKKERFELLKDELNKRNIKMDLFLGNEVYINEDINSLVIRKEIRTLNNTRYILIELPFNSRLNGLDDYLYELELKGYKVIIAHPERYKYFQDDYKLASELYSSGVLFQCNYGSIVGQYGTSSMKLVKHLLKENMVDFMCSDVHKPNSSLFDDFEEIKSKIIKIIGLDKFNLITNDNMLKVINDVDIIKD